MIIRKSQERGYFENDWLKSYHTFSFGDYFDRNQMNFHDLRVINQDVVAEGKGFPTHGHRDMEILTYVTKGVVAHKDSMGNAEQIKAGEVQVMTAGRGVLHSEFNPESRQPLELLQIWIKPHTAALNPSYHQKEFSLHQKTNKLCLIAAPNGMDGALPINQDAKVYASVLESGHRIIYPMQPQRAVWIQMIRGQLDINQVIIDAGDGLAIDQSQELRIQAKSESEFLLFDLVKTK